MVQAIRERERNDPEFEVIDVDDSEVNAVVFTVISQSENALSSSRVQRQLIKKARDEYNISDPATEPMFNGKSSIKSAEELGKESGEEDEDTRYYQKQVKITGGI